MSELYDILKQGLEDAINHNVTEWVQVRHGRWIKEESVGDCCYKCSECGFIRDAYLLEVDNYCPQCGAQMLC